MPHWNNKLFNTFKKNFLKKCNTRYTLQATFSLLLQKIDIIYFNINEKIILLKITILIDY